jgi:putative resolvase
MLPDPFTRSEVQTSEVEHRDRLARLSAEYVEAALAAQGRRLLVVDPSEVDDDLVLGVTEILTSRCGRRSATNQAGEPSRWPPARTHEG